jgi:haloacetate dehalogenase
VFEGFDLANINVGDVSLRVRYGGSGTPVLLLHGHPRTHTTWYQVAPILAEQYTVVCPDLRGYGESSKPPTDADHTPYSKRVMAQDCVALMRHLGHSRFAVVGHDRGSYVASRLALDHPSAVSALAILGGVPVGEALARCHAKFATQWWHWFFFGQPETPERVINADPDAWYGIGTKSTPERLGPENFADFAAAVRNPETVHAMLEDYRAGLGVDRAADDEDSAAGRRVRCPTVIVSALRDDTHDMFGPVLDVWRSWASDVHEVRISSGHHIAEEAPHELAAALLTFLARALPRSR